MAGLLRLKGLCQSLADLRLPRRVRARHCWTGSDMLPDRRREVDPADWARAVAPGEYGYVSAQFDDAIVTPALFAGRYGMVETDEYEPCALVGCQGSDGRRTGRGAVLVDRHNTSDH